MESADDSNNMLSIYDLCRQGSRVLGPGLRYIVWTQGCPFHCDGCISPNSRPVTRDKLVCITDLANDIISQTQIEGITISGGEPFLQAAALTRLLEIVHDDRPDLSVVLYTGYTKEALTWADAQGLIGHLDLLIDGPYVKSLNDNKGVRGSSNQRLHFLSPRLLPWKDELENGQRKVEFHLNDDRFVAYGVPTKSMHLK